ncbi:uncharacterized protein [Kogia breviceps]|uniref:uncharacterized protein n=1 Tax=Kogia breviceps TaxID=27615 RepID=UPI0034D2F5C9
MIRNRISLYIVFGQLLYGTVHPFLHNRSKIGSKYRLAWGSPARRTYPSGPPSAAASWPEVTWCLVSNCSSPEILLLFSVLVLHLASVDWQQFAEILHVDHFTPKTVLDAKEQSSSASWLPEGKQKPGETTYQCLLSLTLLRGAPGLRHGPLLKTPRLYFNARLRDEVLQEDGHVFKAQARDCTAGRLGNLRCLPGAPSPCPAAFGHGSASLLAPALSPRRHSRGCCVCKPTSSGHPGPPRALFPPDPSL